MEVYRISSTGDISGNVQLPASKSMSNRALILQWLSGGSITIENLSTADDTLLLKKHLQTVGDNNRNVQPGVLDCENAGTVFRFLTALLSITPGEWVLTGSERMKERPAGGLVEALRQLGASIRYMGQSGFPPLLIEGRDLRGGHAEIDAGISSQFITALLLTGGRMAEGLKLTLKGRISSRPYIEMTLRMLQQAGIKTSFHNHEITVYPGTISSCAFNIEPDWSSAAFWYEILALSKKGSLFLEGLKTDSLQGDAVLASLFDPLGIESETGGDGIRLSKKERRQSVFTYDFTDCPDLAQPVISTCAGLGLAGRFKGLGSLRIKETDRLAALRSELGKTGSNLEIMGDSELVLSARPRMPESLKTFPEFRSWGDHRMVMALVPLCQVFGTVSVTDPKTVMKSYPGYWDELGRAGFKIIPVAP